MQYPDNQLGLESSEGGSPMKVDNDKEIDNEDGMDQPHLHGGPSGQSGSAQDVLAVGVEGDQQPPQDQPSVEASRDVDDGVDVGRCSSTDACPPLDVPAAASGSAMVPDEDEEPPLVTRREQWELKPLPKRRGRKPATPKPKDEPKPKRGPRGGGSRKTQHFITIDDIVPPTPAPPRAAAPSQVEPVEGVQDFHPETNKEKVKKAKKDNGKKEKEEKVKKDKVKKRRLRGSRGREPSQQRKRPSGRVLMQVKVTMRPELRRTKRTKLFGHLFQKLLPLWLQGI